MKRRRSIILFAALLFAMLPLAELNAREKEALKRSAELIEEGQKLFLQKDYRGAVGKSMEALRIDPWNAEAKKLMEKALKVIEELVVNVREGYELLEAGKLEEAQERFRYVKERINPGTRELYPLVARGFRLIESQRNKDRYEEILKAGDRYLDEGDLAGARDIYAYAEKFHQEGTLLPERLERLKQLEEELALKKQELEMKRKLLELKKEAADLFENSRYEESKTAWLRVLELSPDDEDAQLYLSKIAFKEREAKRLQAIAEEFFANGVRLFDRKLYPEALDQFENALAMNHRVAESQSYMERIRRLIMEQELQERERTTEQVSFYLREGIKYYNLKQYKKSLAALNEGLKLDPENTQVREYIIRDIVALKREEEKEVPPSSPFYKLFLDLKRRGLESYERGDYGESVKYWEEILLIFPYNEEARMELTKALGKTDPLLAHEILRSIFGEARELAAKGNKREAEARLRLILEVDAGFGEAQSLLRELEKEKREEITEEKKVVTEEDKKKAEELFNAGLDHYRKEELEEAVKSWSGAVKLNPDFVEARLHLAKAETKLRNLARYDSGAYEEAKAQEEKKRVELKRHYLDGINYFMNGMYREAITEWETVLKIDPGNTNARQNIERARKRLEIGRAEGSS